MNCKDVRENLIELLAEGQADPAVATHVKECSACAGELEGLRKTMALMDEWEAPEPSPYFLTRLQAHVREEQTKAPTNPVLAWLRRPVLAVSAAVALIAGGLTYRMIVPKGPDTQPTQAVVDVESLDK